VSPLRRALLLAALGARPALAAPAARPALTAPAEAPAEDTVRRGRPLVFPRDHGAHLGVRIEWWYATGWLGSQDRPAAGFQLTFFRSLTGLALDNRSRFAARQLLFAHAALTQLGPPGSPAATHQHDQRIVRWSGDGASARGSAQVGEGRVQIGNWLLVRRDGRWSARVPARGFSLDLDLQATQPPLLQGDGGFSRKGPEEAQASHYYSEPQLAATAGDGQSGRAWLDHEWSNEILHPQAVGWDWIGINLFDGSALTAFVLRRRDGSALWAGGSWRAAGGPAVAFAPDQVVFTPGRIWQSPATGARYPVQWKVRTPAGSFAVRALLDAQELDSRGSTGTIYWEGLSELLDEQDRRVGLGYLELTGYAAPLRLG
jgi:predicted secreted hydrolase